MTSASEKIFVTGASGFIGLHLVRRLLSLGHEVVAMSTTARPELTAIATHCPELTCIQGDIVVLSTEELAQKMAGAHVVYHLAGLVSYQSRDIERQRELNVGGTQKVAAAAHAINVRRFIYTSSIAAMGIPESDGDLADENIVYNLSGLGLGYCDSKQEAEIVVSGYARRGLDAVILCPGIIFGEGDNHPHHFRIFNSLSKGGSLCVPRGGIPFSDINDIIDAHVSALTRGRAGERYCLVSANRTFRQAAETFASIYGGRVPRFEYPQALTMVAGALGDFLLYPLGFKHALTRQQAYLSNKKIFFSSDKAVAELGFKQTAFEETIRRTAPYYLGH